MAATTLDDNIFNIYLGKYLNNYIGKTLNIKTTYSDILNLKTNIYAYLWKYMLWLNNNITNLKKPSALTFTYSPKPGTPPLPPNLTVNIKEKNVLTNVVIILFFLASPTKQLTTNTLIDLTIFCNALNIPINDIKSNIELIFGHNVDTESKLLQFIIDEILPYITTTDNNTIISEIKTEITTVINNIKSKNYAITS